MNNLLKLTLGLSTALAYSAYRRKQYRNTFHNQTVLITGSSRGLGFLLAREFARRGANIVLCARSARELSHAEDALALPPRRILSVVCDVSDREQVENLIQTATSYFGKIDILVNNAGIIQVGPAVTMQLEDFEHAMNIIFYGMLNTTWTVLPQMLERRKGHLVNITSIGGRVSVPHLLPYNSAKFATVGFSEGLTPELKPYGIHVTTITPGLMRTGSFFNAFFKGQHTREYGWFALASTAPLITMNAHRAARQIVQATAQRKANKTLTLPAQILARFHGLFPAATTRILTLVNRLLPAPTLQKNYALPGGHVESMMSPRNRQQLAQATRLGRHTDARP